MGFDTLGSESFPTCFPLRLAYQGPGEVLSYLLDKFCERLRYGVVTGPHFNKQTIQKVELHYEKENMTTLKNNTVQRNENCSADCMCCSSFRKVITSTIQPDPQLRILISRSDVPIYDMQKAKKIGGRSFVRRTPTFYRKNEFSKISVRRRIW